MWLFYAIGSAFFAGVTSILAKCGIRKTDSAVATAVRTSGCPYLFMDHGAHIGLPLTRSLPSADTRLYS